MIEIDLDEIDLRHDRAVLIGRKFNTDPLDAQDMAKLFACCSDVPDLLRYISELESRCLPSGGVTRIEYGLDMGSDFDPDSPYRIAYIGHGDWAKQHGTYWRESTVWPDQGPNDGWPRYVTGWTKRAENERGTT